jgi:hypothetical protein
LTGNACIPADAAGAACFCWQPLAARLKAMAQLQKSVRFKAEFLMNFFPPQKAQETKMAFIQCSTHPTTRTARRAVSEKQGAACLKKSV